ncbi:GmrSD restriction endonuclease domain-containing protein [Saccharicrinis sp. GN24d3]|uniref:GmrSD restriction endonuclease domain-containing protein n=1 Tax=Saccharicrinis sp. GN24d3 TaxID=3458416 RepID=UPI00403718D3
MEKENTQLLFEKIFREHLKIETYSKSIDSLYSPRLKNKIDYKPYYQRNYVWDNNKATYFIESILIGTEIPPLIFFDNNSGIEVIDGRQRFETILRFMDSQFSLTAKGLNTLKQLKKCTYEDLAKNDTDIIDSFLDAKLRIIEFKLVNEPPLDKYLEDRIKKEIFSRYNSGITPLKKSEIDNAIYDDDTLSNIFKNALEESLELRQKIFNTFFKPSENQKVDPPTDNIMSFIRRYLVLPSFPIIQYARGTGRTDILTKLYEFYSDSVEDESKALSDFLKKVDYIAKIKDFAVNNQLQINRLALECILWGIGILELEEIEFDYSDKFIEEYAKYVHLNIVDYTEVDYAFSKQVVDRFLSTSIFLEKYFDYNFEVYISANEEARSKLKELRQQGDTETKLSELESLRLNKPEPSKNSIDDIIRTMNRRKFLVRPSYQRKEVINPSKASSIIESVLLDITLPAIFIYKRKDGVNEVIDGQQRILTLLGYIGEGFIDNKGNKAFSRNHKFPLRKLKILKELEGKKFTDLDESLQNKIFDFQLYIVEIDEAQNPEFDPIDLFIRLNDKPYPIRENSFEMWNSWVDLEIIKQIKDFVSKNKEWLYIKQLKKSNDRDRMETEELITSLAFLEYSKLVGTKKKRLDIFQKNQYINARVSDKSHISTLLHLVTSKKNQEKEKFIESFKRTQSFVKKLKLILLDCDKTKDELFDYLKIELDSVLKASKDAKYFRRTMQDFYITWYILNDINFEMVKLHRVEMKQELKDIFNYWKAMPESDWENNKGLEKFIGIVDCFKLKYQVNKRKVVLSETERLAMIKKQGNISGLSKAPVFLGDEIEVDHNIPLAIGGVDDIENLQIVHKDENRSKGAKSN